MQVRLLHFAIVREIIGHSEMTCELPDGSSVHDLFQRLIADHPSLARLRPSLLFMVNQEYVKPEHTLHDGDEVALIPPVSGGEEKRFRVTDEPTTSADVERLIADPGAGAVVTFLGTVRDNARGKAVDYLEYEAYPPAAERMLEQIGDEISERWGIARTAIIHRTGRLAVGEVSVAIAVAAPHRGDAFEACRYAIDRIKEIVPIWKKEFYADGETWIGSESEYQAMFGHSTSTDARAND